MKKLHALFATTVISSLLVGCATVKEYDPENDDRFQPTTREESYQETPSIVKLAAKSDIEVEAFKLGVEEDEQFRIDRQVWRINVTNNSNDPRCVGIIWRLLDFEYIADTPTDFLVQVGEKKIAGQMIQKTWVLDDVRFAPPPSGYVYQMRVRKPQTGKDIKPGDECLFVEKEENIEEH